jgi:hypothetical protein
MAQRKAERSRLGQTVRDKDNLHLLPPEYAMPVRLQKIDRILSAESELQPLVAKARDLRAFAGLLDGFLPPDLSRQIRVANFRDGEMALIAANASAASKLRLLSPTLLDFLSKERLQVKSVSIRVQPNPSRETIVAPHKRVTLSTATLESLRALYAGMKASPAREALRALLEHHDAIAPIPSRKAPRQKTTTEPPR